MAHFIPVLSVIRVVHAVHAATVTIITYCVLQFLLHLFATVYYF